MLPADPALEPVRDLITSELVATGLPSLAVAVARDGEILWEEGFGWADRTRRLPATEHTPYSIASITKPFTATLVMQLVEQGLVDLDAPVETYLGGARLRPWQDGDAVTVREIANHTGGLPLHYQFFYADEPYRPPPMAETLRRYGVLVTPPGERMQYSNLGYGILDHVVSTVTGTAWSDRLRTEVLVPLGMHRSAVGVPDHLAPHIAARYGTDGVAYPHYDFDHAGGSAVYASAHDLLRFGSANLGTLLPDQRAVLTDASLKTMHEATARSSTVGGYGVGWVINDDEGGFRTIAHSGGMGGVATQLTLVPSERIAVAVLANQSGATLPARVRVEVLAALLSTYAARKDEVVAGLLRGRTPPGDPPTAEVWDRIAGSWTGEIEVHSGDVGMTLDVDAAGTLAIARLGRQPRVVLDQLRWHEDRLQGVMHGDLGSSDTARYPHSLLVDIRPRGDVLDGAVVAVAVPGSVPEGGAPGRRVGNALAHRVRLTRVGS